MVGATRAFPQTVLWQLGLILLGILSGCQTMGDGSKTPIPGDGWRVVERLGNARYRASDASDWAPAATTSAMAAGSQIETGIGGRLILTRADDHVSAGPASSFILPADPGDGALDQRAGRLRYRLAAAGAPFAIETPLLAIEARGTVFEVTVGADATEVAVEHGRVRVATLDGLRHAELRDGQSARASAIEGRQLAFRPGAAKLWQPVEPIVLPAMEPKPVQIDVAPAALQGSVASPPRPRDLPESDAAPEGPPAAPASEGPQGGEPRTDKALSLRPAGYAEPKAEAEASPGADSTIEVDQPFDHLTEGMLDGLPRAPMIQEQDHHGRSK
jgi:hypothetical protein